MRVNHILGIIFSNAYDEAISELTDVRTMGSVPFAGRYRLIDFILSGMVNCGIDQVGVITKSNFQSLMDHLGTGKPWDLSRKTGGMYLLPPFNNAQAGRYKNRVEALYNVLDFIHKSVEEYVLVSDCNMVCNPDYAQLMQQHIDTGADITIAYAHGKAPALKNLATFDLDENGRITSVAVDDKPEDKNYCLNMMIVNKPLFEELIRDAAVHNRENVERDIIQANVNKLKIYGYKVEGFCMPIDSIESYYKANMALLDKDNCRSLFNPDRPVYTKVRDDMPALYGLGSNVKNSLIADGCVIEGEVENSVLFRGVKVEKGAKVKNSIIMQSAVIGENANINCVILDKNVVVQPDKNLTGDKNYPVYVAKNKTI